MLFFRPLLKRNRIASALLFVLVVAVAHQRALSAAARRAEPRFVTVEQFESYVAGAHRRSDAQTADEIEAMELTERLSDQRFARCEPALPGRRAKMALVTLADRAAFLDLPADEIPAKEAPEIAAQKEMIAKTVEYVKNTMHRLPDLTAMRITTTFQRASGSQNALRLVGRSSAMVSYRNGREIARVRAASVHATGLTTDGEFGSILDTVLLDSARGNLQWRHWEQGAAGLEAVFRYSVDRRESHYKVDGRPFAYQGEFAIDPSNGAILRIVLRTDVAQADSLDISGLALRTADIAVVYGAVELGGKTYICPVKGIAISNDVNSLGAGDLASDWLNDRVFENYHLLRSDMRIVPGFDEVH